MALIPPQGCEGSLPRAEPCWRMLLTVFSSQLFLNIRTQLYFCVLYYFILQPSSSITFPLFLEKAVFPDISDVE